MSSPDFSNFERRGNTDNDLVLETRDEVFVKILTEIEASIRSIKIYSHDLGRQLLNSHDIRKHMLGFIRENRHATIQILVDDIEPALKEGHILINLSQNLTTAIEIRKTPDDYLGILPTFIIFDQKRFIYKPDRNHDWSIYSECKFRATTLNDTFTSAWNCSERCLDTRRLSI